MSNAYGDTARANLRSAIAAMEREISQPASSSRAEVSESLRLAWQEVVRVAALGPTPQTRPCPNCAAIGMRNASRCSSCWASIVPLALLPDEAPAAEPAATEQR